MSFAIDRVNGLATVTYHRVPSIEEWTTTMGAVLADPDWKPGLALLLDRSRLLEPALTSFVNAAASFISARSDRLGEGRIAIVSGFDDAAFGMARMAGAIQDGPRAVRAFRSMEAALEWLREP